MTDFKQIGIEDVYKMIEEQKPVVVDIRNWTAYAQGHIKGAILVSDENIKSFLDETDKNKPLICYCYHGISSQSAASFFKDQGFKDVYSMVGGFEAWRKQYGV